MLEPLPMSLLDDLAGPASSVDERVARGVAAHPAAAAVIEPLADMLVDSSIDLLLRMQRHDRVLNCRGKLGCFGAALVVPAEPQAADGWWQVSDVAGAARLIAGAVGLGPRREHLDGGRLIPVPTDALLVCCGRSGFATERASMIDAMVADGHPRRTLEALLSPDALLWQVQLREEDASGPSMSLAVVDTERHGVWLALDVAGGAVLQSTTPTGVWRALCHTLAVLPVPA